MAVDTKEKRLSIMALDAAGTGLHTLPDPTGTFDLGDRQHLLDCYSGIAFASAAVGQPFLARFGAVWFVPSRQRSVNA